MVVIRVFANEKAYHGHHKSYERQVYNHADVTFDSNKVIDVLKLLYGQEAIITMDFIPEHF